MVKKEHPPNRGSLADVAPDVAGEWHPSRNGHFTPDKVTAGSNSRFWWKCDVADDHEWNAQPNNRVGRKSDCPFCAGKQASVTNSLRSLYPELAKQWHPTRNGDTKPEDVVAGSGKRFWWKCDVADDHEWEATSNSRTTNNAGCPCCDGKKVSLTNSLAAKFPDVAAEWHPTRNGDTKPEDVVAGSSDSYWWKCDVADDHEWNAVVARRTGPKESNCPCCAGKKLSLTNSLATLRPDFADQWHPTKNGLLTPSDIVAGTHKQIWWKCPVADDHEWSTSPAHRTSSESGCPSCSGHQVSVTNSLKECFPIISSQWHPTKNGATLPDFVVAGSKEHFWWKCPVADDHEWQASAGDRTAYDTGCPFCDGKKVSITNSLEALFPAIAAQWHPTKNFEITAADVTAGSGKKFFWKCEVAEDHEWEATPSDRTGPHSSGCPCCTGRKVSVTNSLESLFPNIAAQWHPTMNGDVTPSDVSAFSHALKYWWKCDVADNHEWDAPVSSRTSSGSGCPHCKLTPRSAQEIRLAYELSELIEFDIDKHKVRVGRKLRDVDIVIDDLNLIIEFDGVYWHRDKIEQDREKTILLETAGWTVIRVRERSLKSIHVNDVMVDAGTRTKLVADQLFKKIVEVKSITIPNLKGYLRSDKPQREEEAVAAIRRYLNEKSQKRVPNSFR